MPHKIKDQFPQEIVFPLVQEATAGTYVESAAVRTPVQLENHLVMELLWTRWTVGLASILTEADMDVKINAQITSESQTAIVGFSDAAVIDRVADEIFFHTFESTETGAGATSRDAQKRHNLADEEGVGMIYAGTELFLGLDGTPSMGVLTATARLAYRLARVNATELLGYIAQYLTR